MSTYIDSLGEFGKEIEIEGMIQTDDIAVIGMDGKFGCSDNLEAFWDWICKGKDMVREFPEERMRSVRNYLKQTGLWRDDLVFKKGSYLTEIDQFDYEFFKLSPKEASLIDPNQRIFLQTAWRAIEDSGYSASSLEGKRVGVYVGYADDMLYKQLIQSVDPDSIPVSVPGNVRSMMAGRLSYLLDLHGPCMVVDTACSSSLVAIHLACEAIKNGECEMAIAGSTKTYLMPMRQEDTFMEGVMSKDSLTRSYDVDAKGFGLGEGTGVVVLKSLKQAIADHDSVYAVIKGSAITQDGMSIGITAPNGDAQEDVITRAWDQAGITADDISYIEGHGTATELGDAVELTSLNNVLQDRFLAQESCTLGTVKSNLGHLDHAAGIAGFMKCLLAIQHKQIPPVAHFQRLNQKASGEDCKVQVNSELMDWNPDNKQRICGISSFGISGTNAHIVLAEYEDEEVCTETGVHYLFTLSAKDPLVLMNWMNTYISWLGKEDLPHIRDICFTANVGREQYDYRVAVMCTSKDDLRCKLKDRLQEFHSKSFNRQQIETGTEEEIENWSQECNALLSNIKNGQEDASFALAQVIELYTKGAKIDWSLYYDVKDYRRVHLPAYPFKPTRCWIQEDDCLQYHETVWEEQADNVSYFREDAIGTVLLIGDSIEQMNSLEASLAENNKEVYVIQFGEEYLEQTGHKFVLNDLTKELSMISKRINWNAVTHVLYCKSSKESEIDTFSQLKERLDRGVWGTFRLLKEMLNSSVKNCQFVLIGENTYSVLGEDSRLHPEHAAMYGLGKVIHLEYPHVHTRCIDVEKNVDAKTLYDEVFGQNHSVYMTAIRNKKRYVQKLKERYRKNMVNRNIQVKEHGVYIVTGGTGGIGLEICKVLSQMANINLIILNRTTLEKETDKTNTDTENIVRTLHEIEESGSTVTICHAELSDEEKMREVFKQIETKFHAVDGVVHCAGVPGEGFLIRKEERDFQTVMAPKVEGTWLLHHFTQRYKMDFFILFSSVDAITGAPGQGDYCAANSFMDAFSEYRNSLGLPTLSINWTQWRNTGMGKHFVMNEENELFHPMAVKEAVSAFESIWRVCASGIIVGELNEKFVQKQSGMIEIEDIKKSYLEQTGVFVKKQENQVNTNNIELNGNAQGDYSEYEKLIAGLWREVLGYDTFHIHDSFFDIGGDSLKLRMVYRKLEEYVPGKATIVDLFTYSTIYQLARFLSRDNNQESVQKKEQEDSKSDIEELIHNLKDGKQDMQDIINKFKSLR